MPAEVEAVLQQQKGRRGRGYVVVKVVLDQATQRAALLLADSSCLLVSLAGRTTAVPVTVPAPCSDACFLRLQAYGPAGASGFGHNLGTGLSPSPSKVGLVNHNALNTQSLGFGEVVHEPREKDSAGNGRVKGQGRRELFVVTARPAQGGSCTDLRAWSCSDDPAFVSADIELELGDNKRVIANFPSSRAVARLDAPHGLAVKMAASINVLVVYSSSAGKFWVIAGKWLDQTGGVLMEGLDRKLRLVLMKCAVVRCHGPVYTIHVSPLHLFLGESDGVRVWSLRPLIKPGSSSGHSKPRPDQSSNTLDGDRYQHVMESSSASGRITEKCNDNDADLDANVDLRNATGVSATKKLPRKGLFSTGELDLGGNFAGIGNNYRKPQFGSGAHSSRVSSSEFWSLSQLQEALRSDSSSENLPAEDEMAGKTTMGSGGGGVIKIDTRNGASHSCPPEHGGVPIKEMFSVTKSYGPQGDSSVEAGSSIECSGNYPLKTAPRPRTGLTPVTESQLVVSQLGASHQSVSKKAFQQSGQATSNRVQSKTSLDSAGMWFVALSSKEGVFTPQASPRPSPQLQVVDIQGLGLKEYVILDSKGGLHLLTLHEASEERKLASLVPTLRHLQVTMHVASFAVLPLPPPLPRAHRDFGSSAVVTAKRKLWISDGMYSVHNVILPEEKTNGSIDPTTTPATLAVSQAVFTKDRVDGLVAGSPDTVVVLTKGKLVSYVMP